MSGVPQVRLPIMVSVPLHVVRRIGDLACMIRRRTTGEVAEIAAEIESLVDQHADSNAVQLEDIARNGT